MIRRTVVILLVFVGFGLILWSGYYNYHVRQAKQVAAQAPPPWMVASQPGARKPSNAPVEDAEAPPSPLLGKPAPAFTLVDTSGKKVSLASFRGHPVMVNFWATWCGPCKFEIPWLTQLHTQYASQGFEILGVSSDQLGTSETASATKAAVMKAADKLHINYPVLLGGDAITQAYGGVDLLPQSFYIDKKGTVVAVITGAGSRAEAEADIKKAIASGA